jgi:hypothetical protein
LLMLCMSGHNFSLKKTKAVSLILSGRRGSICTPCLLMFITKKPKGVLP